ncbi:MAG: histidine triad nucleotide-binding protein [Gammaproteobacteria bacterium]|nr:histidine triad nucleotide-binding protein [Pseudomonadota bacterium]TDJ41166.1 MAG: histidine triad nucleotide-binding protein [Gammaproteobacteria bacterium]
MTGTDCLFCKIVAGDIAADIVYESETAIAFRDINSQAPTHVLIVPRQHIATINDIEDEHQALIGSLFAAAKSIAAKEGFADDGYRVVMNCNEAAGQTVFHIHLHLLGGRTLTWPPG